MNDRADKATEAGQLLTRTAGVLFYKSGIKVILLSFFAIFELGTVNEPRCECPLLCKGPGRSVAVLHNEKHHNDDITSDLLAELIRAEDQRGHFISARGKEISERPK